MRTLINLLLIICFTSNISSQDVLTYKKYSWDKNVALSTDLVWTSNNHFLFVGEDVGRPFFVFCVDNSGSKVWSIVKDYQYGNSIATKVIETIDGSYIILCQTGTSALLIKFDKQGNEIWRSEIIGFQKTYGKGSFVSEKQNGELVVLGRSNVDRKLKIAVLSSQGELLEEIILHDLPNDLNYFDAVLIDDEFLMLSLTNSINDKSVGEIWKLDLNGSRIWNQTITDLGDIHINALDVNLNGESYLTGYKTYQTGSKLFYVKVDTNGNVLWSREYDSMHPIKGKKIKVIDLNTIYFLGEKSEDDNTNSFYLVTNSEGQERFKYTIINSDQSPKDFVVRNDTIVEVGSFYTTIHSGNGIMMEASPYFRVVEFPKLTWTNKTSSKPDLYCYPNPVMNHLIIESDVNWQAWSIMDIFGRLHLFGNWNAGDIDTSSQTWINYPKEFICYTSSQKITIRPH